MTETVTTKIPDGEGFWLFGYGSLIWKPPPHFDKRVSGFITGYVRRFWQASEDHRGTPEAPGRVVTLIDYDHWKSLGEDPHAAHDRTWGAAYHIPATHAQEVASYLDIREINGYSIQTTTFYPSQTSLSEQASFECIVYIGLPSNPQFVGRQDPEQLARHIVGSRGPSGENREYLFELEMALEGLGAESGDGHVSDLVRRARALIEEDGGPRVEDGKAEGVGEAALRVRGTEEQEEVE